MASKTITARGQMGSGMNIEVECGNHRLVMDQPKHAAGHDLGPTPLDVILSAIAGCFGTIGRIIAHQQKIDLRGMRFELEADYDPDGLLGRNRDVRPGFEEIRVRVDIYAELSASEKLELLREIERRCPVADNLAHGTRLVSELA